MDDYIKRENAKRAVWGCARDTGIDEAPFEYAESLLEDVPSADVAPVRHERWVTTDGNIGGHCSNCGMECSSVEWGDDYLMKPTWNYCPNCGARMDGGNDYLDRWRNEQKEKGEY